MSRNVKIMVSIKFAVLHDIAIDCLLHCGVHEVTAHFTLSL